TGDSVWLIDVKNYRQGDITWRNEVRQATTDSGKKVDLPVLTATDNATNGYLGKPLRMTRNNEMAHSIVHKRLQRAGISMTVRPVVVMMPQDAGVGVLDNVSWRGGIPIVFLPQLLS